MSGVVLLCQQLRFLWQPCRVEYVLKVLLGFPAQGVAIFQHEDCSKSVSYSGVASVALASVASSLIVSRPLPINEDQSPGQATRYRNSFVIMIGRWREMPSYWRHCRKRSCTHRLTSSSAPFVNRDQQAR
ncbi:hypothetical protein JHK84_050603 [Glycine max]|nr:hypothetical protein JHK84_050603 [Glycine max]